jgi:hypothetical protein
MNTKDKHYKEWLNLNKRYQEIRWTGNYETTKEEADLDKLLEHPKFRKFGWYQQGPNKDFINPFNVSFRQHNKQALKKNLSMIGCDYNEDPHDADWFGFLGGWESEYIEYRYHHKNSAKWMWW